MNEDSERTPLLRGSAEPELSENDPVRVAVVNTSQADLQGEGLSHARAARRPQVLATAVVCLAPLCFGTILGFSSPTIIGLKEAGILNADTSTWYASIITLGALGGGLIGGFCVELMGRKGTILASGLPFVAGWLMIVAVVEVGSVGLLLTGRALCGLTMGVVCIAAPTYIAEIASPPLRGALGNMFQVATTTGILLTFVLGIPLPWQWLALACAAIAALMSVLVLLVPETPVYLVKKGREEEALSALRWLRGPLHDVDSEYTALLANAHAQSTRRTSASRLNPLDVLRNRVLLRPILITAFLMIFQQLSGVNDFIFYTASIFKTSGYQGNPAIPSVIVGAVQAVTTVGSLFLIDVAGRRVLLCVSGAVMAVSCVVMGVYYYLMSVKAAAGLGWMPLVALNLYMVAFSLGWGPIPWTQMGELTPVSVKGFASGLAVVVNWTTAFLVTKEFSDMEQALTEYGTMWFFAGVNLCGVLFVAFFVPETKGKSLDQIQKLFEK